MGTIAVVLWAGTAIFFTRKYWRPKFSEFLIDKKQLKAVIKAELKAEAKADLRDLIDEKKEKSDA